jgi:starch phosphorylase
MQEYFLVACSLADLVRRFLRHGTDWEKLPDKAAIQLNDTHPSMAVAELMRILLDDAHLGWDKAWDLTRNTLAYTNHTLLPEALEKWPAAWFEVLLPRQLEIIYEVNRRLLDEVRSRFPGDEGRVERVSLVEEKPSRKLRMANLAIVGSHSTNGVAAVHSKLLRTTTVKDPAEVFPERFSNKTNGVTPRRWLLEGESRLARRLLAAIGDKWVTDMSQLGNLKALVGDPGLQGSIPRLKAGGQSKVCQLAGKTTSGQVVDPGTVFDCQIKRIHEYAATAERAADHCLLRPAASKSEYGNGPTYLLLCWQGRAPPTSWPADHQVHQQPGSHD